MQQSELLKHKEVRKCTIGRISSLSEQEIWASAHGTCDSISLISYAGCLSLSPVYFKKPKIHSKCASQRKIVKKSPKTDIFRSRSSMLVHWKPRQQCLLWCAASLCLSATVRLLDWPTVAETARFEGGTQIWCIRTEDSLNLAGQNLHCWNLRLMQNISHAGCPGLSWMVSAQFSLKMCIAA